MRDGDEKAHGIHPFNEIQSVCQTFTMDWQPDSPPSIGDYLANVKEATRPTLLRNLLQIDIERRRFDGQHPQVADYIEAIPGHEALIRQEFVESTLSINSSLSMRDDDTEDGALRTFDPPVARRLGDYHLLRELGRGGMGIVYPA